MVLNTKLRNFRYARHEYVRQSLCRGGVGVNIYGRIIQASRYTRSPMYYADTRIDFQYLACEVAAKPNSPSHTRRNYES